MAGVFTPLLWKSDAHLIRSNDRFAMPMVFCQLRPTSLANAGSGGRGVVCCTTFRIGRRAGHCGGWSFVLPGDRDTLPIIERFCTFVLFFWLARFFQERFGNRTAEDSGPYLLGSGLGIGLFSGGDWIPINLQETWAAHRARNSSIPEAARMGYHYSVIGPLIGVLLAGTSSGARHFLSSGAWNFS